MAQSQNSDNDLKTSPIPGMEHLYEDPKSSSKAAVTLPHSLEKSLEEMKQEILFQIDKSLSSAINKLATDLEEPPLFPSGVNRVPNRGSKNGIPADKVFVTRNSVLTTLWQVTHIQAMYNMCLTFLTFLLLNMIANYIHTPSEFWEDVTFVAWAFGNFSHWVLLWTSMFLSIVCLFYPIYHWWSYKRIMMKHKRLLDVSCIILFCTYLVAFVGLPLYVLIKTNFPPATAFALLMEQTRMVMKIYAFTRQNVPKALKFKYHQDGDRDDSVEKPCPEVGKLLYFMFAPTLVYRDEYPRTVSINWTYVAWNLLQVLFCIIPAFVALKRFVAGEFRNIGKESIPLDSILRIIFNATFIGTMALFLNFYALLHCWMNAFAEMLRFGDRMFYEDWWNCTTFRNYYRSWNVVVHDWLYCYVLRDAYLISRNKLVSMLTVFFISAVVHEYILSFTFRFFYPVMFVFFAGFGVMMVFATRHVNAVLGNVLLFFSLFLGWGLLLIFYSTEWYARINCPPVASPVWDMLLPRSWSCNIISFSTKS